jgi:hypothetical protein
MITNFKYFEKYNFEGDYFYYIIHMNKSIDKFNVALKKIDFFDMFYQYLDKEDISIDDKYDDVVYLVFDNEGFSLFYENEFSFIKDLENRGDIYVEDYEVNAYKYNL